MEVGSDKGWAQVFVYSELADQWEHQATLITDDDVLPANARFGYGVGIDGNTAVVGAFGNDAVYVFNRVNEVWNEDLESPLMVANADGFGYDTRIDQGNVIVGAQPANKVYVFDEHNEGGQNLAASGTKENFGHSVDLSGDRAIVGDPGANAAYLYRYQYHVGLDEWRWDEEQVVSSTSGDVRFGGSVAIDGGLRHRRRRRN